MRIGGWICMGIGGWIRRLWISRRRIRIFNGLAFFFFYRGGDGKAVWPRYVLASFAGHSSAYMASCRNTRGYQPVVVGGITNTFHQWATNLQADYNNHFNNYWCLLGYIIRKDVTGYLKLGGQVSMRRNAASEPHYYWQNWVGNCPPCPPASYASESVTNNQMGID